MIRNIKIRFLYFLINTKSYLRVQIPPSPPQPLSLTRNGGAFFIMRIFMSGPNKHYLPRFFQGYFFNRDNLRGEKIKSYKKIDYGELYISIPHKREIIKENEPQRFSCLNKKYKEILLIAPPKGEKNNNNFRYTGSYNEIFSNEVDKLITENEKEEI